MLGQKHLTALNLIQEGKTYEEIASVIGVNKGTIARWVSGDPTAGKVSTEFCEELKKLKKLKADETTENLNLVRLRISRRLKEWVERLHFPLSQENMEYSIDIMKVLKEPPPKVDITQIYNMQFQSGEDVVHEFKRLNALAGDGAIAPYRGAVQTPKTGRPASLSGFVKRRGIPKKKTKGHSLSAESEAGDVPSVRSED